MNKPTNNKEMWKEKAKELSKKVAANKKIKPMIVGEEYPELMDLKKLMAMEFPESKWAIEKLIPHQGITIIAGAPGNFKTWLALSMSICIAKGEKFLGQFSCAKAGVLVIDEENHLRQLKERLELLGATSDLPISFLSQRGFLVEKDHWIKKVLDICEKKKIEVIFFDSLIRIHEADENTSTAMSKVFKQIKRFCQSGKTVILTHHERKEGAVKSSGQNRLRGSSDISASVDSHLTVRKTRNVKDKLTVEQPKLRCDREMDPFSVAVITENGTMRLSYEGFSIDEKSGHIKEAIITILSENESGISKKDISEKVRQIIQVGEKAPGKILNDMIQKGEVVCKSGAKNEKVCSLVKYEDEEIPP